MNQAQSVERPILELRNVAKSYGDVQAVKDVSLTIPRGSVYGFLGPNGAGKTTTIRSIMNIVIPDGGEILFDGRPLDRVALDRVGYLPEERGLYRKMKCVDQLAFLAELKSVPRKEALASAETWLDRMELGEWKDRKVDALSKGMQQKVQLAATFMFNPELVILDEPFSGLDPLNVEMLRDIIIEQNKAGCTVIFSTHMMAEAEKLCDAICLISAGHKIIDGSLPDVRRQFPLQSVKVAFADDRQPPSGLPQVKACHREESYWRLTLDEQADPQHVLQAMQAEGPVSLFSANRPSLDEIFITAVKRQRGGALSGNAEEVAS
jgi:ABC-2 type transport system ATP-binding protein